MKKVIWITKCIVIWKRAHSSIRAFKWDKERAVRIMKEERTVTRTKRRFRTGIKIVIILINFSARRGLVDDERELCFIDESNE